ncbi:methanogenesis marker protein Mmp4/MtxX [Methanocella conradii]|uniref:methanogenesis marker protein Mmp4/MtxX n=1 Tax=Methanocella conradii TaxID=1175444 RepID=UPI0024B3306D|nr:methanogenesis marker protein Mmp4/MtxX [Methanocella conradii]MDI6896752.1 methanogenesis marker protein Mmp4/MtxX [Methanocella conradii]
MIWEAIKARALENCARIAVGVGPSYADKTIECAERAAENGYARVTLVGSKPMDATLDTVVSDTPDVALIQLLRDGRVDGVVRGSLGASSTLRSLKRIMGLDRILRVSLLRAPSGRFFFFAPVGVDEGWTIQDKVELGEKGVLLIRRFGIEPKVGVLSGGRMEDRGRSPRVDKTMDDAEAVAAALRVGGIDAKHASILFEDAINEYEYILAPDGVCGNLMFRALCLVGCGEGYGAPLVGTDIVYVDTSRAGSGYENAICMASALVKGTKA